MAAESNNDKAPEFIGVFATGTMVAMFLVCLRLWVRAKILRKVALDDWLVVTSLVRSSFFHFFQYITSPRVHDILGLCGW